MKTRISFPAWIIGIIGMAAIMVLAIPQVHAQDASASPAAATASATKPAETELGDGVVAEVVSIVRGDNDVTIKFKYTNNGSKESAFRDSNYEYQNFAALVYYIDPKNKKKYTAIKDAEGKPLASQSQNIKLSPGDSKSGWVKLPAPPADTTAVTVVLPGAAPFEKVPVTAQ